MNEYTVGSKWAYKGIVDPVVLAEERSPGNWIDTCMREWTVGHLDHHAVPYREPLIMPDDPRGKLGNLTPRIYSHDRWDAMLDSEVEEIRHLAKAKGGEYSGDIDRLLNFRRNGAALNLPMETIWAVYAAKHWDAIQQYIRDMREGKKRVVLEPISGRIRDLMVYLLLLNAMVQERDDEA